MDDFLSLLLVAIFYLVAAFSSKKKKTKKAKKNNSRTERVNARRSRQAQRGFAAAFAQAEQKGAQQAEKKEFFPPEADCAKQRIHLHEVSQEEMHKAGEGTDPCHAGGNVPDSLIAEESPIYAGEDAQSQPLAQDVLRGVIMSEILRRPHERAADKRSGMYHG